LKTLKSISIVGAGALFCAALAGAAFAQPMQNQYVADFGGAFTQATVRKAQTGLAGFDIQVGKMLTNNVSVGLATGFDMCSFRSMTYSNGETTYERLGVIPILAKLRYCLNIAPLTQLFASVAGGAYQTVPHLGTSPIGGVWEAGVHPGGSAAIGFSYFFGGRQGIGAEFEYHFFDSDSDDLFSYFAMRINYTLVKM
jgi:hypothetical protein